MSAIHQSPARERIDLAPAAASRGPGPTLEQQRARVAWLFVTPMLVAVALVAAWPLGRTIAFSFTDAYLDALDNWVVIGFANYVALFQDPLWWRAVGTTAAFTIVSVGLETLLGLVIALTLNAHMPGRGLLRAAVLIPWAIPTVISAKMWGWMLHDLYGVVNAGLMRLGLIDAPWAWLAEPKLAFAAVVAVDVWKATPFMTLLILAALQVLPREIYQAGKIDGASPIRMFLRVTLPLIRPALLVAIIFRGLDAMRVFDVIYVLTGNNPATTTMSVYARQQLVDFQDVGYGSAAATSLFLIVALVTAIVITVGRVNVSGAESGDDPQAPRPDRLLPAGRRHHLLCGVPVLLGDRLIAEDRQQPVPGRILAEQSDARELRRAVPGAAVRAQHPQFADCRGGGDRHLAVPGADGGLCARAHPVPRAHRHAAGHPQRVDVPADRRAIRLVRADPRARALRYADGLVLSNLILTLPFVTWVLTTFMREMPRELEQAAIIDGANDWRILTRVFLPIMGPSLSAAGLLAFILAWNEFMFALTFTLSTDQRTVPVAIALISGATAYELPWGRVMAACVIVTVPLIILVLVLQRYIISGLTAGAVKG